MNTITIKEEIIENMIYEIRGKQVMLDYELSTTKLHDYFVGKIITQLRYR